MATVEKDYDKQSIKARLDATEYGTLSSLSGEEINSRIMVFACEEGLDRFYFLTEGATDKVEELKENPTASLAVLSDAESLDDYAETSVKGKVTLLDRFEDETVQRALPLLARKAPMLEGLIASGSLGNYVLIKLDASEVAYRVYADILQHAPKTIYRFADA